MNPVIKIYELKTLGFNQLNKELKEVTNRFNEIKKAKLAAEGNLISDKDVDTAKKFNEELAKLKIQEQEAKTERQQLMAQMKSEQLLRQKAIQEERERKKAVDAVAGSYNAIYKEYRELYKLMKATPEGQQVEFRGNTLQYDEAIRKLKELAAAEQDWRRQWSRDSLLVGEYTSGIVQAFKQMGLDDLVGGQIERAKTRATELDTHFKNLSQDLMRTGQQGSAAFAAIEKEMIDNRNEAIQLRQQIANLEKEFRGATDVGDRMVQSLKQGFKELKGMASSFAIQFIGIQALWNKAVSEFNLGKEAAMQIEGVSKAFQDLNKPYLLDDLRKATRGAVTDLQLMQTAVQARNFEIPLEQLSTLLDFARRRAKETGENVDYLVQSIILGIGRKSPLILDNLGISAVKLREKLKGVSDEAADIGAVAQAVGAIIQEENAKVTQEVDTLSEKVKKNEAQWANLRTELAARALPAFVTLSAVVLTLVTNLPILLGILALLTIGYIAQNKTLALLNLQMLYYNARIMLNYAALGILSVATVAYNGVLIVLNGTLRIVTTALSFFGVTLTASTGILGITLTAIALLAGALMGISRIMANTTKEIERMNLKYKTNIEIQKRAAEATANEVSKVEMLTKVIKSNIVSIEGKEKALKELIAIAPEYLKGLNLENIATKEGKALLDDYIKSLREKAAIQAAMAVRDDLMQKEMRLQLLQTKLERRIALGEATDLEDLTDEEKEFVSEARKQFAFTRSVADLFTGNSAAKDALDAIKEARKGILAELDVTDELIAERYQQQTDIGISEVVEINIAQLRKDISALDDQINNFKGSQEELNKLIAQRAKLQEQLDKALGVNKKSSSSKISGADQDKLRDIDAQRDELLANEEQKRLKNEISEELYLKSILAINQSAISKKLELIKGANAAERKLIADLKLDQIKLEKETNDKIFALKLEALKNQLDESLKLEKENLQKLELDASKSPTDIAQAKVDSNKRVLELEEKYQKDVEALQKTYGDRSIKLAKEIADQIRSTRQQLAVDTVNLDKSYIETFKGNLETQIALLKNSYAEQRRLIRENVKNKNSRNKQLDVLETSESISILAIEIEAMKKEIPVYKKLYEEKKITQLEYLNFLKDIADKEEEILEKGRKLKEELVDEYAGIADFLKKKILELFNFDEGSEEGKAIGRILSGVFDFAATAMNHYFDQEEQRIRQNLELQLERIDLMKEQALATAQSKEEIASIEKQYDAQKKLEEKKAYEELKRTKRAELQIALAVELANIAASNAKLPFPFNVTVIGILSGLALAKYAMNLSKINSAQFEFGGQVPKRGGRFGGKTHREGGTPFVFQGQQYEAEVDELAVIRTKNAPKNKTYTITGNQEQIASALNSIGGGVDFAPGAKLSKFEFGGMLGGGLRAPQFVPSSQIIIQNNQDISSLVDAVNNRFDRLEVVQVTSTVTKAQQKQVKQQSVGVL